MRLLVFVKTATGGAVSKDDAFQRSGRTSPAVMSAHDAHAVEAALRLAEACPGSEIVIAAIGPSEILGGVREAIALGADRAIMLCDPALDGSDLLAISRAMAAVILAEAPDLALACPWSGDIDGTILWVAAATRAGLPVLTQARSLTLADGRITIERQVESGDVTVAAPLPCMVEVSETINKPRYPTMKGKLAAKSKPLRLLSLPELGLDAETLEPATRVRALMLPPARTPPEIIEDVATAPARIISFLEDRKLV
jgi:electron transfer flavoprotein beta subunit